MPRYEYECERCGPFEAQQRMSDEPLTRHHCGGNVLRVISKTAFSLKGSGWYTDGYSSGPAGGKKDAAAAPPCGAGACGSGGCPAMSGQSES